MPNFLLNVFKNCIKSNTDKLYVDNVHENKVGSQSPRNRLQTQMHTVVNDNQRNIQGDGVGWSLLAEERSVLPS